MKSKLMFVILIVFAMTAFAQNQSKSKPAIPDSENEKREWIKNNPKAYQEAGGQYAPDDKLSGPVKSAGINNAQVNNAQIIQVPAQPVLVVTGDSVADHKKYRDAMEDWRAKMMKINESNKVFMQDEHTKTQWIEQNQTLYNPQK